jgi:ABC-type dipeptide/oligopeptide/nickel transport system permease subunit
MNKSLKIGIAATIILTLFAGLTGFFEGLFEYHIGVLSRINDGFLILGLNTSGLKV